MIELRRIVSDKLTPRVLDKIKEAPKPTKTAEVIAVTKELKGLALSLEEIAEIINIADPGRERSHASDYDLNELKRNPELIVVSTPSETYVRYVGSRTLYSR